MTVIAPSMRTFRLKGPFGLQMSFKTKVPGTLWFQYPRARSSENFDGKQSATEPTTDNAVQGSEQIYVDIPMGETAVEGEENPNADSEMMSRAPSPTPTEVVEPELTQEEIVEDIQKNGIKVRDFFYEKMPPGQEPAPEIFYADKALGDYDYKLSMNPRQCAVPGKILRRLLDLGWITLQEARAKWHEMDWKALGEFDKRTKYPWRAAPVPFPIAEAREAMLQARKVYGKDLEKSMIREQTEELMEHLRSQIHARSLEILKLITRGEKRYFDDEDDWRNEDQDGGSERGSSPPDSKRRKVGEEATSTTVESSVSGSRPSTLGQARSSNSPTASLATSSPPNPMTQHPQRLQRSKTKYSL